MIFAYDVSTGIKNHLKGSEIVATRLRFPRYIDESGVITPYNHDLSWAFTVVELADDPIYRFEILIGGI